MGRSRHLEQFAREVRQDGRPVRAEVDVIFDAYPTPSWPVNSRLDSYDGADGQHGIGRPRQTRRLVYLQSQPMSQAVTEGIAVAAPLNVVARQRIGILSLETGPHLRGRGLVGATNYGIQIVLFFGRRTHHHRARDVGAISAGFGTEIH